MRLKKLFSAALAALLVLSLFSGCEVENPTTSELPTSESFPPPTDYVKYSGKWEETDEPLTICITADLYEADARNFCRKVKDLLDYHTGTSVKLEWVVLPEFDDDDGASAMLTRLRTELLAGGGPDVFICGGPGAGLAQDDNGRSNFTNLFPVPEKMLYNDTFLPLDGLLENPQYMHPENFQSTVLAAGRTEQGQLILPTIFTYSAVVLDKGELEGPAPESLKELAESPREVALFTTNIAFMVGRLADFRTDEPLFSEEELQDLAVQAMEFNERGVNVVRENPNCTPLYLWNFGRHQLGMMFQDNEGKKKDYAILPQWDREGGVTARIEQFVAVNRNTKQANNAMFLLDALLDPECLRGWGYQVETGAGLRLFGASILESNEPEGLAIDTTVAMRRIYEKAQDLRAVVDSQITSARFRSEIDPILNDFNFELVLAESELDACQAASNAYDKILMVLAE